MPKAWDPWESLVQDMTTQWARWMTVPLVCEVDRVSNSSPVGRHSARVRCQLVISRPRFSLPSDWQMEVGRRQWWKARRGVAEWLDGRCEEGQVQKAGEACGLQAGMAEA